MRASARPKGPDVGEEGVWRRGGARRGWPKPSEGHSAQW